MVNAFSKSRCDTNLPSGLRTSIVQWPWTLIPSLGPPAGSLAGEVVGLAGVCALVFAGVGALAVAGVCACAALFNAMGNVARNSVRLSATLARNFHCM